MNPAEFIPLAENEGMIAQSRTTWWMNCFMKWVSFWPAIHSCI